MNRVQSLIQGRRDARRPTTTFALQGHSATQLNQQPETGAVRLPSVTRRVALPLIALCIVACNNQPAPVATKKVVQPPASATDLKAASRRSLYAQFIEHPTGRNGFEDYLKAADALSEPTASAAYYAVQNRTTSRGSSPIPEAEWAKGISLLDLKRNLRDKTKDAFALIKSGNQKPFVSTISHDPLKGEMFGVTAFLNRATREACLISDAEVADGHISEATDLLLGEIEFQNQVGSDDVISDLSANNMTSVVLKQFDIHMSVLKADDYAAIVSRTDALLRKPPKLMLAFDRQLKTDLQWMNLVIDEGANSKPRDPKTLSGDSVEYERVNSEVRKLSPSELKAMKTSAAKVVSDAYSQIHNTLQGPEAKWPARTGTPPVAPKTLIGDVTRGHLPFLDACSNEARTRTQLRILRLRALIESYRLKNSRLPSSLADLSTPDATADPYAASQFNYTVSGDTYNVSSAMTDKGFPIEMVRRLPPKK